MTKINSDLMTAFRLLDLTPGADPAEIRAAWKAMVRSYHPDRVTGDKDAANRRLAEINAAFELTSAWTKDDARTFRAGRMEETRANQQKARQQAAERAAADRAAAARHAQETQRKAAERRATEAASRHRAHELEREEAIKRAKRAARNRRRDPLAAAAEAGFLSALRDMAGLAPRRDLGFA